MNDTQCIIAVQNPDNTVTSVVLEHDGDLKFAGRTLENYYQNYQDVQDLVNLGDLKSLGDDVTKTCAYFRDGHEDDLIFETYHDTEVFDRATESLDDYVDYCYLYCKYEGNFQWLVRDLSSEKKRFESLKKVLRKVK